MNWKNYLIEKIAEELKCKIDKEEINFSLAVPKGISDDELQDVVEFLITGGKRIFTYKADGKADLTWDGLLEIIEGQREPGEKTPKDVMVAFKAVREQVKRLREDGTIEKVWPGKAITDVAERLLTHAKVGKLAALPEEKFLKRFLRSVDRLTVPKKVEAVDLQDLF